MSRRWPPGLALTAAIMVVATVTAAAPLPTMLAAAKNVASGFAGGAFLPLDRWGGSLEMFSYSVDIISVNPGHSMANLAFSMADGIWGWALMLIRASSDFDSIEGFAPLIDSIMQDVLNVLWVGQGLSVIGWFVLISGLATVVGVIWRSRGRDRIKRLLVWAALAGLLAVSISNLRAADIPEVAEADRATYQGYESPVLTPGWLVSFTGDIVNAAGDAPASALVDASSAALLPDSTDASALSCATYLESLHELAGGSQTVAAEAVSATWEAAALNAYIGAQFGTDSPLGYDVYCRMLDHQASISGVSSAYIDAVTLGLYSEDAATARSALETSQGGYATRYGQSATNEHWARAMLAWAVCDTTDGTTWTFDTRFLGLNGEDDPATWNASCQTAMTTITEAGEQTEIPGEFAVDAGNRVQEITRDITNTDARDSLVSYLTGMTGKANDISAAWVYSTSVLGGALPWLLLGVGNFVVKLLMLGLMVGLWFTLIASLFTSRPLERTIAPAARKLIGATLLAFGFQLILSFAALMTSVVCTIGWSLAQAMNAGSFAIFLGSWSPAIGILMMVMMFKRAGLPNPLSLQGAKAWRQGMPLAAGAAAGAAGGFLAGRFGDAAKSAAGAGAKRLGGRALEGMGVPAGVLGTIGLGAQGGRGAIGAGTRKEASSGAAAVAAASAAAAEAKGVGADGVQRFASAGDELAAAKQAAKDTAKSERSEARAARSAARQERIDAAVASANARMAARSAADPEGALATAMSPGAERALRRSEWVKQAAHVPEAMAKVSGGAAWLRDRTSRVVRDPKGAAAGAAQAAGAGVASAAKATWHTATNAEARHEAAKRFGGIVKSPKTMAAAAAVATVASGGVLAAPMAGVVAASSIRAAKAAGARRAAGQAELIDGFRQGQRDAKAAKDAAKAASEAAAKAKTDEEQQARDREAERAAADSRAVAPVVDAPPPAEGRREEHG